MQDMTPPSWLIYPKSTARLVLKLANESPVLTVFGNPQGLASLTGIFIWLQSFSDHGALSVSALSFVNPQGALALSVVLTLDEAADQGRVVRLDRDRQFEWRIGDEQLLEVAVQLHRVATSPDYVDYFEPRVCLESDARVRFEATASVNEP